ncbi:MAG: hypothetical protein AB1656_13170 [Candidatus Omnitrophota bacterium]
MISTNLILIEGISGSGKSTTAQRLYLNMIRQGIDAQWFYEHEVPHPIFHADEVEAALKTGLSEPNRIHKKALENWEKLASELKGTQRVIILESAFFQTSAGSLLLMGAEKGEIIAYSQQIPPLIHELHPILIYLYQDDIAQALHRINEKRGGEFYRFLIAKFSETPLGKKRKIDNVNKIVEAFQHFREFMDALYEQFPQRKLAIENSQGDWDEYRRRIGDFLGIDNIDHPSHPINNWADFAGRYREIHSGQEWIVAVGDDFLYFDNAYKTRLIHKTNNVFYLEGSCVELSFECSGDSRICRAVCQGHLPGEAAIGTVWEKIDA